MVLFETKLPFAYSCRWTWPHCNTIYCRWGRCDTTDITNINAIAATRVSQGSQHSRGREMSFPWKIREISGNLPSSPWNFWKEGNLREFSGNGYGRFKCCFWECYVVFHMFCPQFPGKTTGKISHSPIHQGLIYVTYLPIVNWWMACIYPNNGVHFHFMKIRLCYVMDLKLIYVINVSYMFYRSYLLQILPAFSKWIVKWKENRKTKDSWFWW